MSSPIEEQLRAYFNDLDHEQEPIDVASIAATPPSASRRLTIDPAELPFDVARPDRVDRGSDVDVVITPLKGKETMTMKPSTLLLLAAAAIVVIAGVFFAIESGSDDSAPVITDEVPEATTVPPPETVTVVSVVVPGTEQWTDTGIDLSIDDSVGIEADGMITPSDPDVPLHGPDGVPDRPDAKIFNVEGLRDENHNSLIGRIGEAGAPFTCDGSSPADASCPFQVGSQLQFTAETEGRLFLGINDTDVADNAGEFTATITVNSS